MYSVPKCCASKGGCGLSPAPNGMIQGWPVTMKSFGRTVISRSNGRLIFATQHTYIYTSYICIYVYVYMYSYYCKVRVRVLFEPWNRTGAAAQASFSLQRIYGFRSVHMQYSRARCIRSTHVSSTWCWRTFFALSYPRSFFFSPEIGLVRPRRLRFALTTLVRFSVCAHAVQ